MGKNIPPPPTPRVWRPAGDFPFNLSYFPLSLVDATRAIKFNTRYARLYGLRPLISLNAVDSVRRLAQLACLVIQVTIMSIDMLKLHYADPGSTANKSDVPVSRQMTVLSTLQSQYN